MKIPPKFTVMGIEYCVVFVGKSRMSKESGYAEAYGCVDQNRGIVYLAKALKKNPTMLRDTLLHEVLGHVVLETSGLGYWLREKMRLGKDKKYEKWIEAQETFVRWYTPALITTLKSLKVI